MGSLSHPRENSDAVEGTRFPFRPSGAEQRRSAKDFLLGRNPPSRQHTNVCPTVGVILQESSPSHPGFGMCFHLQDCEFLPCSGQHHFLGTSRPPNLSNAEYLTNKSLDVLQERKCQFYNSPGPQEIVQNFSRPVDQRKVSKVLTSELAGVEGTPITSRPVTGKFCCI